MDRSRILVPLLTDHGVSGRTAALATLLFGLTSIVGRVGNGYLVDRIFAPRVAAVLFAGAAIGVALLLADPTSATASVTAALLGLAVGAESDVIPFLVSRYFGMRAMAMLYGCVFGVYVLGNATGRYLFAAGYDATGSYALPLGVCARAARALERRDAHTRADTTCFLRWSAPRQQAARSGRRS